MDQDACASDGSPQDAGLNVPVKAPKHDPAYKNPTARRAGDSGGDSGLSHRALHPDLLVGSFPVNRAAAGPFTANAGEAAPLVVIVGPTASGKSALAVKLAEEFGGAVVNYDSVQLYREFNIGSAKPSLAERRNVPHFLLDCLDPGQVFTAGDYRREAEGALAQIRRGNQLPILVGGTGLYLRALLMGLFEGPKRSEALREKLRALAARRGPEHIHLLLERLDPVSAARIGRRDLSKAIRAVEVRLVAGQPISLLHERGRQELRGYRAIKIGFDPPRAELYQRIDKRVQAMFQSGLVEETARLMSRNDAALFKPLGALGYRQTCALIRGEISLAQAVSLTQKATRHYAKRQMTWFRREPDINWYHGFADDPTVELEVISWLRRRLKPDRKFHQA